MNMEVDDPPHDTGAPQSQPQAAPVGGSDKTDAFMAPQTPPNATGDASQQQQQAAPLNGTAGVPPVAGEHNTDNAPAAASDYAPAPPQQQAQPASLVSQLPAARVKRIMQIDDTITHITPEAVALVAKATEMFIPLLIQKALGNTPAEKSTLTLKDLCTACAANDNLEFLEDTMVSMRQKHPASRKKAR
eukprot:TRINITY_DN19005_c0_g1_i1.p1 TRINITY_DN19005_c0_g1~~TRINITY_DN19005_c0_g1_i1.p1  ORF type:complete len:189 (+),score=59.17 TRINITY_DN19005_c0_g1_i1:2-568(+)